MQYLNTKVKNDIEIYVSKTLFKGDNFLFTDGNGTIL